MKIRLLAAGTRMPGWVDAGVEDYARRMGASLRLAVEEIPLGRRSAARAGDRAVRDEGRRMLARIKDRDYVVALDVGGRGMSTEKIAAWLEERMNAGADLVLMIGGPDGLSAVCRERSDFQWSLSPLTLPHGLVRIVVAEQLYRAWSLLQGHPYHRS